MKRNLKKLLCLLMALCLCGSLLPVTEAAEPEPGATPVETITLDGAPVRLTEGAALPQLDTQLRVTQGGTLAAQYRGGSGILWFSSADGQTIGKPLPETAVVEANTYYYLGVVVVPETAAANSLRAAISGAEASVQSIGANDGALFLSVRYDRRTHALERPRQLQPSFDDVSAGTWYYDSIMRATQQQLMSGVSASWFAPEQTASRAMLVTILYRLQDRPDAAPAAFPDVEQGRWYSAAVAWAVENGIARGYSDGTFRPDEPVTREQAAVFFYRYAVDCDIDTTGRQDLQSYADAGQVHGWAQEALQWVVHAGIIGGMGRGDALRLDPLGNTIRAQLAAIACRFVKYIPAQPDGAAMPQYFTARDYTIAYIPLDNRPVNSLRPALQARSSGLRVLMPEESLYATRMDGQTDNPNGTTYGDREGLLAWLQVHESECDAFVLSADQLLSGGLVSSRALCNEDLTLEQRILDYLTELSSRKPVYVFDTVMRLASTVGYMGLGSPEYRQLRSYGSIARPALSGDELTPENIAAGYRYNAEGQEIETDIDEALLQQYLGARTRKLELARRLLDGSGQFASLMIGIDDSVPHESLQTNEIAYLRAHLGSNATLFCGTDELGVMAMAQAYSALLPVQMRVQVRYFGGGEDEYADAFDTDTLRQAMERHLDALNLIQTDEAPDAQVLVLSRGASQQAAEEFQRAWQENEAAGCWSIVLDTSRSAYSRDMTAANLTVTHLLGYSCWGTAANTVGIGLSMGLSRWNWLATQTEVRDADNEEFARSLVFAFVKDLAYCRSCRSSMGQLTPEAIEQALLAEPLTGQLLGRLAGSVLLTELDGQAEAGYRIPTPQLSDFSAPLARSYEIYFAVTFADEPPAPDTPATPTEPELPEEPSELPQAEPAWAPKGAVHWV